MEPVEFRCSECDARAATIELLAPTTEPAAPDDFGFNQWKVRTTGPVSVTHWVLRGLADLQNALREGSVTALLAADPDAVTFWCAKCLAVYCKEHWFPIEPEMDDGFYDATYGTCPRGHRVILDD